MARPPKYAIPIPRRFLPVLAVLALAVFILADRLGFLPPPPAGPDHDQYNFRLANVINVVDGDTLDIDLPDPLTDSPRTRIRLWGVDTPETRTAAGPAHFGPEASAFARSLALDQQVLIVLEPHRPSRDRYNRLLAYVYLPPDTPVPMPPSRHNPVPLPPLGGSWPNAARPEGGSSDQAFDPKRANLLARRPMLNELLLLTGHAYADERFPHFYLERFLDLQSRAQAANLGLWASATPNDHPQWYRSRH